MYVYIYIYIHIVVALRVVVCCCVGSVIVFCCFADLLCAVCCLLLRCAQGVENTMLEENIPTYHVAVCQIIGSANWTAKRRRAVKPTKWNWGMTTGMTALWRAAQKKQYPKTKHCLARGHSLLLIVVVVRLLLCLFVYVYYICLRARQERLPLDLWDVFLINLCDRPCLVVYILLELVFQIWYIFSLGLRRVPHLRGMLASVSQRRTSCRESDCIICLGSLFLSRSGQFSICQYSGEWKPYWRNQCWQIYAHRLHEYVGASAWVAPLGKYN